jgi:hypothetical protein
MLTPLRNWRLKKVMDTVMTAMAPSLSCPLHPRPPHLSLLRSLLFLLGPRPFRVHLGPAPSISGWREKESDDTIVVVTLSMIFISLGFVVMSGKYLADLNPLAS